VDVNHGTQLWGEQYNRPMADIFALQEEITREIFRQLRMKLAPEDESRLAHRATENTEAYQLYLNGRYHWNKRTDEGVRKGLEYFQQAIEKDPSYALAYAGVADSYTVGSGVYLRLPPKESCLHSKAAARKALELDDTLAEAHTTLADRLFYCDWDWANAEREFQRAIELNPDYPTGPHWYSEYLSAMGRHDEAIAMAQQAQELDPFSMAINWNLGITLYNARQYDRAIEQLHGASEINPNHAGPYSWLGLVYEQKRMYSDAMAAWQEMHTVEGDSELAVAMGEAYRASGYRGALQKRLKELNKQAEPRYSVGSTVSINLHDTVLLGQKDEAFILLEKAYKQREIDLLWLKADPIFDPLRSDPRFQDLLRRMNFPP
jgi:tetratricopeptide (TPR) repeat protein